MASETFGASRSLPRFPSCDCCNEPFIVSPSNQTQTVGKQSGLKAATSRYPRTNGDTNTFNPRVEFSCISRNLYQATQADGGVLGSVWLQHHHDQVDLAISDIIAISDMCITPWQRRRSRLAAAAAPSCSRGLPCSVAMTTQASRPRNTARKTPAPSDSCSCMSRPLHRVVP